MGRGRQSFPTTDRHPCCLLPPPAVSHDSGDTALGAGEIHKPLQCDIMEVMPFFLSLTEGNFARVVGSGGTVSVRSGEHPEDGIQKRYTGSG